MATTMVAKSPDLPALTTDLCSMAALSRCSGRLERVGLGHELPAPFAPTPAERAALTKRSEALATALQPCGRAEAERLIGALFAVTVGSGSGEDVAAQIKLYASEMSRWPLFAVAAACRGHVSDGEKFRPALGELVVRARRASADARAERARIADLLAAKVVPAPSEDERKRVAAAFREKLGAMLAAKEAAG